MVSCTVTENVVTLSKSGKETLETLKQNTIVPWRKSRPVSLRTVITNSPVKHYQITARNITGVPGLLSPLTHTMKVQPQDTA